MGNHLKQTDIEDHVTLNFSDRATFPLQSLSWSENGVTMLTRWFFREGAELELSVQTDSASERCQGVVIACDCLDKSEGIFSTTLYFLDPPANEITEACRRCGNHRPHSHARSGQNGA